jgi:hypothetical protein
MRAMTGGTQNRAGGSPERAHQLARHQGRFGRAGSVAQGRHGQGQGLLSTNGVSVGFQDGRDRGALDSLVRIFAEKSCFNMCRSRQAFLCWSQAALRCGKPWCYSLLRVTLRPGHGRFPAEPGDVPAIQTPETRVWMLGLTPDLDPGGMTRPLPGLDANQSTREE